MVVGTSAPTSLQLNLAFQACTTGVQRYPGSRTAVLGAIVAHGERAKIATAGDTPNAVRDALTSATADAYWAAAALMLVVAIAAARFARHHLASDARVPAVKLGSAVTA
jgi:hypothetical protein